MAILVGDEQAAAPNAWRKSAEARSSTRRCDKGSASPSGTIKPLLPCSSASGTTQICIHLPSLRTYAEAVYHDANANRHIDRTAIGLPAEGFGFSNNPHVFLGIPAWRSVRLSVAENDMHTSIKLRYP